MPYEPPGIQGWMNEDALHWLYGQAMQAESVVEIGCWKGRSTHALLSGCPGPVFAVDHFKGSPNELIGPHEEAKDGKIGEIFRRNVGHFPNLVLMEMESVRAASFFREKSVDMVFIDGCHMHEAVKADIAAWRPVCRRLLCGHDLNTVHRALEEMGVSYKREVGSIWSCQL
jgi:hypothetical protein